MKEGRRRGREGRRKGKREEGRKGGMRENIWGGIVSQLDNSCLNPWDFP